MTILEGLIETFRRNPFPDPEPGSYGVVLPFTETDVKPFYADKDVPATNGNFTDRADLFHQQVKDTRWERPRVGTCNNGIVIEKHIEGEVWARVQPCGGVVRAVETRINGAVRVDGVCMTCKWEIHRAGLLED